MAQAPPSEPIGTRDIDSTPPAKTRSSQPEATFCAATFTASRPEAQKRLSWTPATVSGSPALIAAVLAMSMPWSPTGVTHPSPTSSTRFGSSCSLRISISCIKPTTRSTGFVVCSEPLLLPLPRGVRIASKINASVDPTVVLLGQKLAFTNECIVGAVTATQPRRTQEERRAATRAALLDAALACLVEHGYEGTTTGRVCERAGVSRGAHQHHFGTRPARGAAALEELAMRRLEESRGELARLPAGEERIEQALDAIW